MARWRAGNLLLRFVVEIAALAGLAFWGWTAGHGTTGRVVLAIVTPTAAAWLWGMYAAPASEHRLRGAARLGVEWSVLGGGAAAMIVAGVPWVALAFLVVAVLNAIVLARTTPPPRVHSANECQCCSGADTGQLVSQLIEGTASAGAPAADPTATPSAVHESAATPHE